MAQQQPLVWSLTVSSKTDRWGYDQDFGIVFNAYNNRQLCPANADQLVTLAIARMRKTKLAPQFSQFLLDYKADSWLNLVNNVPEPPSLDYRARQPNQRIRDPNRCARDTDWCYRDRTPWAQHSTKPTRHRRIWPSESSEQHCPTRGDYYRRYKCTARSIPTDDGIPC